MLIIYASVKVNTRKLGCLKFSVVNMGDKIREINKISGLNKTASDRDIFIKILHYLLIEPKILLIGVEN